MTLPTRGAHQPESRNGHEFSECDPIYGVVWWCKDCMAGPDEEKADEPCTGEYAGPGDDVLLAEPPMSSQERHMSAWKQHQELHG